MKRFSIILLVFIVGFLVFLSSFPVAIYAATSPCPPGWENLCTIGPSNNPKFVGTIVQILIVIAIILSVVFLIWGGIRWIMSGGDKGKVEAARSAVTAAVIGLVVSILAYFIVTMIVYVLTGTGDLKSIKFPRLID